MSDPTQTVLFVDSEKQRRSGAPCFPVVSAAHVEGEYRFTLHRRWANGPLLAWVMLNPSTADEKKDDPTIQRIMRFSYRWGYGALVVVNLYPFRSSHPREMKKWRDKIDWASLEPSAERTAYYRNAGIAAKAAAEADGVVVAWGATAFINDVKYWCDLAEIEADREIDWLCLGVTQDGAPKHPLARGRHRVPDGFGPITWRCP